MFEFIKNFFDSTVKFANKIYLFFSFTTKTEELQIPEEKVEEEKVEEEKVEEEKVEEHQEDLFHEVVEIEQIMNFLKAPSRTNNLAEIIFKYHAKTDLRQEDINDITKQIKDLTQIELNTLNSLQLLIIQDIISKDSKPELYSRQYWQGKIEVADYIVQSGSLEKILNTLDSYSKNKDSMQK